MTTLLVPCLLEPGRVSSLAARDWERLLVEAQAAGLTGRLWAVLADASLLEEVPEAPRRHLEWARALTENLDRAVRWEVKCLGDALQSLGQPLTLLKGAAYVMAGLPPARGRLLTDVDVLVKRESLAAVERLLEEAGWRGTCTDPYDQRYYRQWMHELPPMVHGSRATLVDVHHGILPMTFRVRPDMASVWRAAVPVPGQMELRMLAPADMILHATCHLFLEGEFDRGLRGLVDLDLLLRHFSREETFWDGLVERGRELQLARPLFYCLRYTSRILGTPMPAGVLARSAEDAPAAPVLRLMDAAFERALAPPHPQAGDRLTQAALAFLYLRGHALRMPVHLLLPHLARKSWRALLGTGD